MALTTLLTGRIALPSDQPAKAAELVFALSDWDKAGADVFPAARVRSVLLTADGTIPAGFALWRNSAGGRDTVYRVTVRWSEQDRTGFTAREAALGAIYLTGPGPVTLADLLALPAPVPTVPDALAQALAATADANRAAGVATGEASVATEKAAQAEAEAAQAAQERTLAQAAAQMSINGQWTYTVETDAALLALTGMTIGQTAYVKLTRHQWKYAGSAWVDQGLSVLAPLASNARVDKVQAAVSQWGALAPASGPIAGKYVNYKTGQEETATGYHYYTFAVEPDDKLQLTARIVGGNIALAVWRGAAGEYLGYTRPAPTGAPETITDEAVTVPAGAVQLVMSCQSSAAPGISAKRLNPVANLAPRLTSAEVALATTTAKLDPIADTLARIVDMPAAALVTGYFPRNNSGALVAHADWCYRQFDVVAHETVFVTAALNGSATQLVVWYDGNGTFLGASGPIGTSDDVVYTNYAVVVPAGAVKAATCSRINSNATTPMRITARRVEGSVAPRLVALEARPQSGVSALAIWAGHYASAPLKAPAVMASAPVVTTGANGAASALAGGVAIAASDPRLTKLGAPWLSVDSTWLNSERSGSRIRFDLYAEKFEVRLRSTTYAHTGLAVRVDGEFVALKKFWSGLNRGGAGGSYMLFDFGADAPTYPLLIATPSTAGTGYAIGDQITLASGAVLRVSSVVAGGAVDSAEVITPGGATTRPSNTQAQTSTTGAGTGATFTATWGSERPTKKARQIELTFERGVYFGGLVLPADGAVAAAPAGKGPLLVIAGDSITDTSFPDYTEGMWANQVARGLGLADRFVRYGQNGRGWIRDGSTFEADRAGIIACAPDLLVIALGTNDRLNGVDIPTLTAAITAHINALHAALPNLRIVVLTGWRSSDAYDAAILAGVIAAATQSRVRGLGLRALGLSLDQNTGWLSSDGTHPHQQGHDAMARTVAPLIGRAFAEMIA